MRTATELQQAFCRFRIPGEARQVLDTIMLKTYGFNKKEDAISLSQFEEMTGLSRSHVCRALNQLLSMNIIAKNGTTTLRKYRVNKAYTTWRGVPKQGVPKRGLPKLARGSPASGKRVVPKAGHTIDTLTIDTIQKTVSGEHGSPTPAEEAGKFFTDVRRQQQMIDFLVARGSKVETVRAELDKFLSYWTEPNRTGTRVRWQDQKHFDVKRRLATWFSRVGGYQKKPKVRFIS